MRTQSEKQRTIPIQIYYVLPDSICEKLLPVIKNRYITTEENISYENARELEKLFTEEYPEQAESGVMYGIRFSTLQTNSTIANNFVLQAAMLYGAVVLMIKYVLPYFLCNSF